MKIIDYLNKEEIVTLYEQIHIYECMGNSWQYRAVPLLNLCLELEEVGEGETRQDRLLSLLSFETLIQFYQHKNLRPELQIVLDNYIESLPEFKKESIKQNDQTLEVHGYCAMLIHRYIYDISKPNSEFFIFKSSWADTKEKADIASNFFNGYVDNENKSIFNILHNTKRGDITNLDALKFFMSSPTNEEIVPLLYKVFCFNHRSLTDEHQKFIEINNLIEKIEFKDFLYTDLHINNTESTGTSKV